MQNELIDKKEFVNIHKPKDERKEHIKKIIEETESYFWVCGKCGKLNENGACCSFCSNIR